MRLGPKLAEAAIVKQAGDQDILVTEADDAADGAGERVAELVQAGFGEVGDLLGNPATGLPTEVATAESAESIVPDHHFEHAAEIAETSSSILPIPLPDTKQRNTKSWELAAVQADQPRKRLMAIVVFAVVGLIIAGVVIVSVAYLLADR